MIACGTVYGGGGVSETWHALVVPAAPVDGGKAFRVWQAADAAG